MKFKFRIQFDIDGSEKARIDSSGNLLVGKTGTTFSNSIGMKEKMETLEQLEIVLMFADFNRLTSDGNILMLFIKMVQLKQLLVVFIQVLELAHQLHLYMFIMQQLTKLLDLKVVMQMQELP